jgi:membrane-associated phospholipid phosphatase
MMEAIEGRKTLLFLKKKQQKDFRSQTDVARTVNTPARTKSFLLPRAGRLFFKKLALACLSVSLITPSAWAQTAQPAYFMPPKPKKIVLHSAVVKARPVAQASPVIDSTLIDTLAAPAPLPAPKLPWYETDWGVLGIGIVATALTFPFDHGINQFADTRLSLKFRRDYALPAANILELAPLAFAGATMVQSPVSDPELAHASSIAVTSAAIVTAEVMGMKYVIGRNRPGGPNSDPFVAHPFDASRSTFSIGAVFPGEGAQTSSFPSGHTALAFALITPYAEIYHAPWLYAIPIAVGLGRVAAVDGHWASDVVGGAFVGWLTADLTRRFFPNSDYGLMIFGDGQHYQVGISGRF